MPIKQIFEKKEDAPEWLRGMLLEDNGKFVFEAETSVETAGLKKALEAERKAKSEFEKSLKAVEGIDAEEYKRLKAEAEKAETEKLKSKGDWETRENQLKTQLAADLAKREEYFKGEQAKGEEQAKQLRAALEEYLIEAQASAALIEPGKPKGNPTLLMPHIRAKTSVIEENGKFVARVLDADGKPRIADVKGNPFTIGMLVDELRADKIYMPAFEASGAGGSGAPAHSAGSGGGTITLTRDQARDPQAYRQAKEAAAKAGGQVAISE